MWDVPDGCAEQFDIQAGDGGRRMVVLKLRRKASHADRVYEQLEQWYELFCDDGYRSTAPDIDEAEQRKQASVQKQALSGVLVPLYFLRSKYWILWLLCYLLACGGLTEYAQLPISWVLPIAAVVFLALGWLLRRLLGRGIRALERRKADKNSRAKGL